MSHDRPSGLSAAAGCAAFLRAREFVVDVDHQDEVERLVGQRGWRLVATTSRPAKSLAGDAPLEEVEHLGLDVGGETLRWIHAPRPAATV